MKALYIYLYALNQTTRNYNDFSMGFDPEFEQAVVPFSWLVVYPVDATAPHSHPPQPLYPPLLRVLSPSSPTSAQLNFQQSGSLFAP